MDKHRVFLLGVALIGLLLVAGVLLKQEVVTGNVYALGVPVGGLTRQEAAGAVSARAEEIEQGSLTFAAGTLTTEATPSELKILLDEGQLMAGLDGYVSSRSRLIPSFLFRTGPRKAIAAPATVVSGDSDEVLSRLAASLSAPAQGTRYGFVGRDVTVLQPEDGQTVTASDVRAALGQVSGSRIPVSFTSIPAPKGPDLPALSLLAEAETAYDVSETGRNVNLALAAEAVQGKVLMPGQTYSFNREAGERTEAKGYRYANVVVGDHLEPGLAGGICQVTTTLFDAAAIAGLDFPEVHNHGIPVEYVNPGLDAAVAWDYLDLKVRNSGNSPAVFGAWVENGKVTVRVFGKSSGRTYKVIPITVKEYPEPGKQPGLLVETYRAEMSQGQEVGRSLLMRSLYLPTVPLKK